MMPAVWNVAKPLEVEYRQSIHQSRDQSNSGRKGTEKQPYGDDKRVKSQGQGGITNQAFDSTLSRREVKGEEPHI